jgi:hypothetical protein
MIRRAPLALMFAAFSLWPAGIALAVDEAASNERVGFRVGGLVTSDGLHDAYGDGWELTLFFTEKIAQPLLLDIRLGALYLGDLKYPELDDSLTFTNNVTSSMRILYISAGPMYGIPITGSSTLYASAAAGLYSVSMEFDSGVTAWDYSDQTFGVSGGLGIVHRVSASWSIDANATVHYMRIEESSSDLYYAFTDGADAPLIVDIAFGLTLDLH